MPHKSTIVNTSQQEVKEECFFWTYSVFQCSTNQKNENVPAEANPGENT